MLRLVRHSRSKGSPPLSSPLRLKCGHLRSRAAHYPWCRICLRVTSWEGPHVSKKWRAEHPPTTSTNRHKIHPWRANHKGKMRRNILKKNHGTGIHIARHKQKVAIARHKVNPHSNRQRNFQHSREHKQARWLLFREGNGRLTNLKKTNPSAYKMVREFCLRCYDEYSTRMKFAGREIWTFYKWRKVWYGQMKKWYGRDVVKAMKMEQDCG